MTTTTTDPTTAIPLLQRTYHTVNNGVPAWVFVFVFVVLSVLILVALSRIPRAQSD